MKIERLTLMSEEAFSDLEERIMADVVKRLKMNGAPTATTDWEITRLQQFGVSERDITKWIAETLHVTDDTAAKMLSDELYEQYNGQARAYKIKGVKQIPFEENTRLQSLIKATTRQTHGTFQNITQSMGFAIPQAGGLRYQRLREFYTQTLDAGMMDITSGAFSYEQVLERTVNTMTNSGLRYIDYASGTSSRVEVACRRALMTGYRQVQQEMTDEVAGELGAEYYEVSAHSGARPEHAEWQGGIYTMEQLENICGLGDALGLCGINCYHSYEPYFPGISKRRYTDKQLHTMRVKDAEKVDYDGNSYNKYEALQKQRSMETQMRKYRRDADLLKQGGASKEMVQAKQAKYKVKFAQYKDFSAAMKLPMQRDRIFIGGG